MTITKDYNRQDIKFAHVDIGFADLATGVAEEAIDLPPGAVVADGRIVVTEVFDSATSDALAVGDSLVANRYLAAGDLQALGVTALVPTGYIGVGNPLEVTLTSVLGPATQGAVRLEVAYYIRGRSDSTHG